MTNPGNAIGTNAAYSGRTSANAFNDVLSVLSRGIVSGWACSPDTGMSVVLGGDGTTRDVAIAEDNIGNRTTINNISGAPVSVTIGTAPLSNSRIDLIVAYVDNPPEGTSTITDNYEACGLIVVQGTASASPTAPDDSDIRTAITTDGGSGVTAYYVELAQVTVASGTTVIDATMIKAGISAGIVGNNIQDGTITAEKIYTFAGNNSIYTQPNIIPVSDTPTAWVEALGGPFNDNPSGQGDGGYFLTEYSIDSCFDSQPQQWGWLETMVCGLKEIYQRWTSRSAGHIMYRMGNANGWWNNSSSTGNFRILADDFPNIGTITMKTGYTKVLSLTFAKKSGGLVCWQINFTNSSSMTAGTEYTIASVSSGYRPPVVSYGSGYHSDGRPFLVRIYDNGDITATPYVNINAGGNNLLSGSYYV